MTSWNRRLSAAARTGAARGAPRAELLAEATEYSIDPDDQAALQALATIARDRPGFEKSLTVRATDPAGGIVEHEFEVVYDPTGPVVRRISGTGRARASEPAPMRPAPGAEGELSLDEEQEPDIDVVSILTDTLVETPDLVAIFRSVGHEALWANDAFVTLIPIRESDKIWLVELLDEWSKGHYEVKILPALVKYGRWRGRLTLLTGDDSSMPVSAVIVAHRDRRGEIEAVSFVARDISDMRLAEASPGAADVRFEALVENATDIICVLTPDGVVEYASPATARILGYQDGALQGVDLLSLVHTEDAPFGLRGLVNPDELGIGVPVELRLRTTTGNWRHLEVVATDLTDNPVIAGIVLNARDVTERVEAVQALAAKAYTDALTGLPNRVRILDRMGTWLQGPEPTPATVLLVDFDRMTSINETFGRGVGDEVVIQVAGRIRAAVSETALVGRLGSDEFVVVVPGMIEPAEGLHLANRLRGVIGGPVELPEGSVQLTASIGVVAAGVGQEPDEVLLGAGRAMAHAKESGRDRVEVFNESLALAANRRRTVEQQLRRALDNDGVRVHYQPIVDIETETVTGAEALLRVHDDEGSLLSPAEFIEAAESSGLIARLGSQVLHLTCEQLAAWGDDLGGAGMSEISVNISPRQLGDPNLPAKVVDALNSVGVVPERLCLEITESILIGAQSTVDAGISYLRDLGVRIGLDDFGTGQSSLGYLKRFPLDFVKIDKSLISGLGNNEHDTAIVRATIELAHNLGLQVVAVGVEFDEQLDALQILGCDRAQGYLFAPPLPPDQFATEVREGLR